MSWLKSLGRGTSDIAALRDEVRAIRRELRERMLQYNHQLGRLARAANTDEPSGELRLSGRTLPLETESAEPEWDHVGDGVVHPDPEGREWTTLAACPVCGDAESTLVCPWNKLILLEKAPDHASATYNYSLCHGCGVLYAARRPLGARYHFLLEHFGEVTAKRGGGGAISDRVLNPYPLSEADRAELLRLAAPGVYVSDHLGLTSKQHLAPLMRDRFENGMHVDLLGALLSPRGARVLEIRSRSGTIPDGLRRAWGAEVYAMPIWQSQQLLLRDVFQIETSELIDFDNFSIPFDGPFDLITSNHMFTHMIRPRDYFAELRRSLKPGGHIYLYNEPDDVEFLAGNQSMIATLNPLHMQAFDQRAIMRGLAANGFETVFIKRRNLTHIVLARMNEAVPVVRMTDKERKRRRRAYEAACDRAVLSVPVSMRPRVAEDWKTVVARVVAHGTLEYDEKGELRLVGRELRTDDTGPRA